MEDKIKAIKDAVLASVVVNEKHKLGRRWRVDVRVQYSHAESRGFADDSEPSIHNEWAVEASLNAKLLNFSYGMVARSTLDAALDAMLENVKAQSLNLDAFDGI